LSFSPRTRRLMLGWAAVCAVVVTSLSLLVAFNLDGVDRYDSPMGETV
jgi:hypothetical protein